MNKKIKFWKNYWMILISGFIGLILFIAGAILFMLNKKYSAIWLFGISIGLFVEWTYNTVLILVKFSNGQWPQIENR